MVKEQSLPNQPMCINNEAYCMSGSRSCDSDKYVVCMMSVSSPEQLPWLLGNTCSVICLKVRLSLGLAIVPGFGSRISLSVSPHDQGQMIDGDKSYLAVLLVCLLAAKHAMYLNRYPVYRQRASQIRVFLGGSVCSLSQRRHSKLLRLFSPGNPLRIDRYMTDDIPTVSTVSHHRKLLLP